MDPCASGRQPVSRVRTLYLLEILEKSNQKMRPRLRRQAIGSVHGALGILARESRPDLSGFNPARSFQQSSAVGLQETNRVIRLAEAHADHALPVCKIPINQICFASYGDVSGESTRAEQAQVGYVVMIADQALLGGMAAHVTLVTRRSHRVKRVEASASVAKAICLSEAIAQGDWIRAL